MVVFWSPNARGILRSIFDYYLEVASRKVAVNMTGKIRMTAHALGAMPYMGLPEKELPGYRSIIENRIFKIIYRVDEVKEFVEIVSIFDCRRDPAKIRENVPEKS